MKSPESQLLAAALLSLTLGAGACRGTEQDNQGVEFPAGPSSEAGNNLPEGTTVPEGLVMIDYNHPICQEVREAKAAIDAMETNPAANREQKADVAKKFFVGARKAGGLEKAIALCLEKRRPTLSGKKKGPKGK